MNRERVVPIDHTVTDSTFPVTPDGRYFVVRGRLWRCSDPSLADERRQALVDELMHARLAVRLDRNDRSARGRVDAAKRALGERGPVWWADGAPDYNRHLVKNTSYAGWWASMTRSPDES